jgi:hypothetical protein
MTAECYSNFEKTEEWLDSDDELDGDEYIFDFKETRISHKQWRCLDFFNKKKISEVDDSQGNPYLSLSAEKKLSAMRDKSFANFGLVQALVHHNIDKIKQALAEDENLVNYKLSNGWSLLMYAVTVGSFDLVEIFAKKGADINYTAGAQRLVFEMLRS